MDEAKRQKLQCRQGFLPIRAAFSKLFEPAGRTPHGSFILRQENYFWNDSRNPWRG